MTYTHDGGQRYLQLMLRCGGAHVLPPLRPLIISTIKNFGRLLDEQIADSLSVPGCIETIHR
jgi:hypothetical protein